VKCYEFAPANDAFELKQTARSEPVAGPGRVIVRVRAVSLNYRDIINLRNKVGRKVGGRIPCSDGAGEVVAIGAGVTKVRVGERVCGLFFQSWQRGRFEMRHHQQDLGGTVDGLLTEYADLSADGVIPFPEHLSFEEAACLPCAALTAWQALFTRGRLQPGDTVLCQGTGGVSLFGVQFAAASGAKVVLTSRSAEKLARGQSLGASILIDTTATPDWDKEVYRLTDKRGVDHVLEVGGGGTLGKSLASVCAGGHVALIGVLTGFGPPTDSLFPAVAKNATISGIYVGSREEFAAMNAFMTQHALRPVIDRVFPFEKAIEAFAHLESGQHFGKVVVAGL
jgi:NADPH:quinone reductase-like Zn-dependent oxidoreductase